MNTLDRIFITTPFLLVGSYFIILRYVLHVTQMNNPMCILPLAGIMLVYLILVGVISLKVG